jgi:hypothetical protein
MKNQCISVFLVALLVGCSGTAFDGAAGKKDADEDDDLKSGE